MTSPLSLPKRRSAFLALAALCALLVLLVLPAFRYPILSDTIIYALLGQSVWLHGTYTFLGDPFAKHLPLHAVLSFPFTALLGLNAGMKADSLVAGWGVLVATFLLFRRAFSRAPARAPLAELIPSVTERLGCGAVRGSAREESRRISGDASSLEMESSTSTALAFLTAVLVLLHPGFIFMAMAGSADLLFACLFLLALWAYLKADEDPRWYLACGIFTGLACLTRYNGVALFPLMGLAWIWSAYQSRGRDASPFGCAQCKPQRPYNVIAWGASGLMIGVGLFGIWMVRSAMIFGGPFATPYAGELQQHAPSLWLQLWSNVLYYANPVHNVFPFLFPFALYGLFRYGRRHLFLVWAMLAAWALTAVWWVQAIRFAFPGYVILLGFAALGLRDLWQRIRPFHFAIGAFVILFITLQGTSLCLYTYGQCNAAFDRTFGFLPRDMGLSTEGFTTWDEARNFLDASAESGAVIVVDSDLNAAAWATGVFRKDLKVMAAPPVPCTPFYHFTQHPLPTDQVLFTSPDAPETSVILQGC